MRSDVPGLCIHRGLYGNIVLPVKAVCMYLLVCCDGPPGRRDGRPGLRHAADHQALAFQLQLPPFILCAHDYPCFLACVACFLRVLCHIVT